MEKLKKMFKTAGTKHGAFSVGMTAIVIAIVVVVNLIAGQLPERYRNVDVSSTKIYEISDTSKELLEGLDQKINMTVLAVKDDTDERITTFLSKYAALSKKISLEWIDPVLHPSALSENTAQENTIVITCEDTGKSTTVSFDDILVKDMYSYYYTGTASETEFDGEGQLTSAVNYVINDENQKIYCTSGHGETSLSATISDLMDKNNCETADLNLLMSDSIPEDCDLLLMNAPTNDLTEDEAEEIRTYLTDGGDVMILLGDTNSTELTNLSAILKEYGMESVDGYIADMQRCYQGNYFYIFPTLSVSGNMANGISSEMVMMINAHGLNLADAERDTISTDAFMTTSENAYAVTEDSQTEGTYTLGAVATETISSSDGTSDEEDSDSKETSGEEDGDSEETEDEEDSDSKEMEDASAGETKESRLTVITSASLIDSQITDTLTSLENTTLFMNAVTENFDGVTNISIEPKSLAMEYNTIQHTGLWSLLVIFGVPLIILIVGFVVWYRRRKA